MNKVLFLLIFFVQNIFFRSFAQAPTWSGDIAKIMYGNCTSCHRPGGMAPFSLTNYEDVSPMATWIEQNITNKNMPPWPADEDYKSFVHERVLSQQDKQTFSAWVSAGTPSGDLRFTPPIPQYSNGSQLGSPSLSLQITPFTVTQNGDQYRNFVLPMGLTQVNFANAIEVIPGNPSIVHHVLVFVDTNSTPVPPDGLSAGLQSELIYSYVPGSIPYYTPIGTGFRMPTNSRIILQIHYAPGSLGQIDNTTVNFNLTTTPQRRIFVSAALNHLNSITNGPLMIPANETRTFNESFLLNTTVTTFYAFPHMHLIGKSIQAWANKPVTNDTIRFVKVPDWDFNWQDNYVFSNAIKVPAGSTLKATAHFDNTATNPNNPSSPPQNVVAGEGTNDEMMIVFFAYSPYLNGDENTIIDKRIIPMGATTFCEGQSVRLKTIQGEGYTYQWKLNGSTITGATNYYLEATQSGNYTVLISLGSNNVLSDPVLITVNSKPVSIINSISGNQIPQILTAQNCGTCNYQWYLNDVAIGGAMSVNHEATQPGIYYLETYNGCYSISDTVILGGAIPYAVSVSANPTNAGTINGGGSFILGSNATVIATPSNGYNFTYWTENNNVVSYQNSYSFVVNQDRNLVANFEQVSEVLEVQNDEISVYPNPSNGYFTLKGGQNFSYSVFNLEGHLIKENKEMSSIHSAQIARSGAYFIRLDRENGQREYLKIVVR